jgi:cytochrome oxidase assembly protein ShyY1
VRDKTVKPRANVFLLLLAFLFCELVLIVLIFLGGWQFRREFRCTDYQAQPWGKECEQYTRTKILLERKP